jgi:hypothetical protein
MGQRSLFLDSDKIQVSNGGQINFLGGHLFEQILAREPNSPSNANIIDLIPSISEAHYLVNLKAMVATCFPWKRAAANSFWLGIRSP